MLCLHEVWKSGMLAGCEHTDASGTPIAFPVSGRVQRYGASSVIRRPASFASGGGGKNGLRRVRQRPASLLRPQDPSSPRPPLRRHAGLPGARDPPRPLRALRRREAREAGLAGRQPALHQAVRLLRGPALSPDHDQGGGRGTWPRLARRSRTSTSSTCASNCAGPGRQRRGSSASTKSAIGKGHTYRIVVSDLERRRPIWFGGTDRSEASLDEFYHLAGPGKMPAKSAWRSWTCGRRSATPPSRRAMPRRPRSSTTSSTSCGTWARRWTRSASSEYARLIGRGPALHQGAEVHAAVALGEPQRRTGRASLKLLFKANKRLQHGLPAQGVVRPTLGLPDGPAGPDASSTNWRDALKWQRLEPFEKFARDGRGHWDGIEAYCQPENKVALGFVEGLNNKIRVDPAARLRLPRRGVPPTEDPHLHARPDMKSGRHHPLGKEKTHKIDGRPYLPYHFLSPLMEVA